MALPALGKDSGERVAVGVLDTVSEGVPLRVDEREVGGEGVIVPDGVGVAKALPVPLGDALGDGVTDGEGKALGVAEVGAVGALDAVTRVGVSVGDDVSDGVRGGVTVTLGVGDPSVPVDVVEMWVETVPGAGGVGV